jgi:uncharacterized membrane protein
VNESNTISKTVGLGAISGLRSMAGPAAVSRAAANGSLDNLEGTPFAALGSPVVSWALKTMAVGELIVDKLPVAPSRTSVPPLLGRAASGAFVGAVLFASAERPAKVGAALGVLSALAGAYAGERLREFISERVGMPDPVVALIEDGFILICRSRLLR